MVEDSPKVLSYVKKLRLTIRSGSGLPEGVHWATELYFWRTRQTRLDFLEGEVEEEDSREFRGRMRMATMMPSSVASVVEDASFSMVDMLIVLCDHFLIN